MNPPRTGTTRRLRSRIYDRPIFAEDADDLALAELRLPHGLLLNGSVDQRSVSGLGELTLRGTQVRG